MTGENILEKGNGEHDYHLTHSPDDLRITRVMAHGGRKQWKKHVVKLGLVFRALIHSEQEANCQSREWRQREDCIGRDIRVYIHGGGDGVGVAAISFQLG